MATSVGVAGVNGCLQGFRAPSVARAEPSVVSPPGAELGEAPIDRKAQQWEETWETWEDGTGEGVWEGVEGGDGGGETGKGIGGMVVSIDLETRFCLVVMASKVMKSSGSTWVSSSSVLTVS